MFELKGNIWDVPTADIICITTNGIVKTNGEAVMGGGIAKECANKFRYTPVTLGDKIKNSGNHVHQIHNPSDLFGAGPFIYSFPTKEHWRDKSLIPLIERSAKELVRQVDHLEAELDDGSLMVLVPRPGCGLGGLQWGQVKGAIEPIFDNRFFLVSPPDRGL
jgi:hypothetical protein